MTISRRTFLFASSGAATGTLLVPGLSAALDNPTDAVSGLVNGNPKPLRFESIPGFLSAEQIAPHHTAHYGGALKGYLAADAQLEQNFVPGRPLDAAAFGALERARTSKGNSVLLHELYFDALTPDAPDPTEDVRTAIAKRFGTFEQWADDFQACAREAAGWAMLVRHPVNGKLYNLVSDEHAIGLLCMATPLLVLDVYEHAFYVDYQNRKGDYITKFMEHIDWDEVNRRYRSVA